MAEQLVCPRCGGTEFAEVDCGPDSYEDDVFYLSDVCKTCGLWRDGWNDRWYVDVQTWRDVEDAEEFVVGDDSGERE